MTDIKTTRRQFIATSAMIGVAGFGASFPSVTFAADGTKTLNLRIDGDNEILDPGYMRGGTEIEAQKQCLPFLADYDLQDGSFSWKPTIFVNKLEQRDPTHIDFELREGLLWSGGYGAVRANDVKYSFERMLESDWKGYFEALDHVEVTGERSGTIVLNKPFAPFIMITLCHGPGAIVCEKAVEEAGGTFTNDFPAVCGPYTYKYTPGQRAVFEMNPDWKLERPNFDRIVAHVIPEVKAGVLALEAGELDCTEIGSDTIARYANEQPANTDVTKAGELQYMWLGMNTQHPKLQDIKVRQAIQHAVDVDSILAGAYSNVTSKSYGIVCPGLVGQRQSTGYSYDPDKARALLEEAGVEGLEVTLRTLNNQERMLTAQIIQANLGAVGIKVAVLPLDSGPFWDMGQESKGDTWKDMELWIMRFGTTPDPYEAASWFVSSQVGKWNWERWTDEEYDRLYQEGIKETDPKKREKIYVLMQEIMENTGAYVFINHEPEAFGHGKKIAINAAPSGELNYRRFAMK